MNSYEPGKGRHTFRTWGLSSREEEVLSLIAKGLANKEIAAAISVEPKTVERHINNLYGHLGLEKGSGGSMRVRATLAYLHWQEAARIAEGTPAVSSSDWLVFERALYDLRNIELGGTALFPENLGRLAQRLLAAHWKIVQEKVGEPQ